MQKTNVFRNQHQWFQNQLLLLAAIAVTGVFWLAQIGKLGAMTGPLTLVLIAQAVLFIFLLRRPIWAIAALIVGQFTSSNYMIPLGGTMISLRLIWALFGVLLLLVMLFKNGRLTLGGRARRIIIPAVILFCVATIANYVDTNMSTTLTYLRLNFASLIILVLLPAVIENEQDLKRLALVALITCSVSAVFAILQWLSFHTSIATFKLYDSSLDQVRAAGLSETTIQLGFILPLVLLPMAAFYFFGGLSSRVKKLLVVLAIIILIGLFFSFTRSGIYSLVPGILLLGFFMKGKLRKRFILLALVSMAAFLLFINATGSRYSQTFGQDSSSSGRLVLWSAGLDIIKDHPVLGIGTNQFKQVSQEYASDINPTLMKTQNAGTALGVYPAHNDFITIWSSFGTAAFLAFLWYFLSIFRNFREAYRKAKTPFLTSISIGCLAALLSFIVNMATHNIIDSSMLPWILGGFSIATMKIILSKRFNVK